MSYAIWLAPLGLGMGLVGLVAFLWSMKSGQLEDLEGAAHRVLLNEGADVPLTSSQQAGLSRKDHDDG
jgi:cbb3-type cytochrome oxidase maturation protein